MAGENLRRGEEAGVRVRIKGLEYVPASELVDHPKNWRTHPAHQRDKLKQVMEKVGLAGALVAYRSEKTGKMTVIDGHLRKEMLSQEGENGGFGVPVLVLDVNDEEAEVLLATHDVITTMASPDEKMYEDLLKSISASPDYAELVREFEQETREGFEAQGGSPVFELVPVFDEGYDAMIIFSKSETEWAQLQTVLGLSKKRDRRGGLGLCQVMEATEFLRKWRERG